MTTSSDHRTPAAPRPSGEHWYELTATLSRESTEEFGQWIGEQLSLLEIELEVFESPRSVLKTIGR